MTWILVQRGSSSNQSCSSLSRSSSASQLFAPQIPSTTKQEEHEKEMQDPHLCALDDLHDCCEISDDKISRNDDFLPETTQGVKNEVASNESAGKEKSGIGEDVDAGVVVKELSGLRIAEKFDFDESEGSCVGCSRRGLVLVAPPVSPPKLSIENLNCGSSRRAVSWPLVSTRTSPSGSNPSSPRSYGEGEGEGYNSTDEQTSCFGSSYDDSISVLDSNFCCICITLPFISKLTTMATCGIQHLFENLLPENGTLLKSLASWNQNNPMKPIELSSFTEIFGKLHFKVTPEKTPYPYLSSSADQNPQPKTEEIYNTNTCCEKNASLDSLLGTCKQRDMDCFVSLNSDSPQLCTEGLGFKSLDEVENAKNESGDVWRNHEKVGLIKHSIVNLDRNLQTCTNVIGAGRSRVIGNFPPPISCIGRRGKPRASYRSYKYNGRFVLTEIKILNHKILHASREDGCLKLHFV